MPTGGRDRGTTEKRWELKVSRHAKGELEKIRERFENLQSDPDEDEITTLMGILQELLDWLNVYIEVDSPDYL